MKSEKTKSDVEETEVLDLGVVMPDEEIKGGESNAKNN